MIVFGLLERPRTGIQDGAIVGAQRRQSLITAIRPRLGEQLAGAIFQSWIFAEEVSDAAPRIAHVQPPKTEIAAALRLAGVGQFQQMSD